MVKKLLTYFCRIVFAYLPVMRGNRYNYPVFNRERTHNEKGVLTMQTITFNELRASLRKQITEWVFDHVCGAGNIDNPQAQQLIEMHHELEHCDDEFLASTAKYLASFGPRLYNPNVLAVNAGIVRVTR